MGLPRSAIHIFRINWHKRQVVLDLIRRDVKLRYLGSLFGGYWNFIHPLAMIAIFTAVFSQVMRPGSGALAAAGKFSYTIYLCAGLLPWTALNEMVNRGTRSFIENAGLIKKVAFPMEILQTVVAGSATITFLISFGIYIVLLFGIGYGITPPLILLPLIFGFQILFAVGMAMIFSILNVYFRDMEQAVTILFNLWFWLTPIVYPADVVPDHFKTILYINPMYYFVSMYHDIAFYQRWPEPSLMIGTAIFSILIFILGSSFMCRFKNEVPDEI